MERETRLVGKQAKAKSLIRMLHGDSMNRFGISIYDRYGFGHRRADHGQNPRRTQYKSPISSMILFLSTQSNDKICNGAPFLRLSVIPCREGTQDREKKLSNAVAGAGERERIYTYP